MQSYYNTAPQGQMKGIVTRPNVGLNEYTPEIAITDNHMSDMLDADVYRDEAMVLSSVDSIAGGYVYGESNTDGIVQSGIALQGSNNGYGLIVFNKSDSTWFMRHARDVDGEVDSYALSSMGLPVSNLVDNGNFDSGLLTPWTASNCGTPTISNNSCVFTATAQNGGIGITVPVINGKTYTIRAKVKDSVGFATELTYSKTGQAGQSSSSGSGENILEAIVTANSTDTLTIRIRDSRASAWNAITVYWLNVTNVTPPTRGLTEHIPYMLPNYNMYNFGACNFSTESNTFTCFTCEYAPSLVYYNNNAKTAGYVALPFYPKKIVTHVNRIFAIDTFNKLWWCRAGDLFSWYSNEYNATMLATSQNMKATAYTLTGVIDTPRPITATITIVADQDTYGSLSITGTNALDEAQTETLALSPGRNQSLKSFKTISTVITSGWVTGGTADTIEFGVAPVSGGFVQADAGYWTFEREKSLTDLCVMSDNLYVFASDNIYVFRGYSYDTFSLSLLIANIGIKNSANFCNWLTTINNTSYFVDNGDIYEFNGSSYPKLISHPETVNGNISNGMYGGVEPIPTTFSLASDNDHLYVYNSTIALHDDNRYYIYDTQSKSWWHMTGFSKNNSNLSVAFKVKYLTLDSTDGMISVISSNTTAGVFDLYAVMGHKGLYSPFIVTKAFNSNPSELGTLTSIILQVRGTTTETSSIILSYSLTSSANDFKEFKRFANHVFNGDIENLDIPVPVACIANAHHYRIKIECTGYTEIYNIERRFRMRGRTR